MEKGWVKIYSSNKEYKAELIKTLLESNGIEAVLLDKSETVTGVMGVAEVYVKQDVAVRAISIINNPLNE